MNNLKHTGVRISEYPTAPVNSSTHKYRIELDHSFISWAPAYFGTSTINKNFQIPIGVLRADILGVIGVQNMKPKYRDYIKLWHGDWNNQSDRVKSYIYTWNKSDQFHDDYIPNKHGLDTSYDSTNRLDRIFILNDAPIPLQATYTPVNPAGSINWGNDPNVSTVKVVTKKYIDDRHNGFRKIEKAPIQYVNAIKNGSELKIRPYTCFYQYQNLPAKDTDGIHTINICDTQVLQDGRSIIDVLRHNRLRFYIRLTNKDEFYYRLTEDGTKEHFNNLKFLVNGENEVIWSYDDELNQILRENRPREGQNGDKRIFKTHIFIRCEAQYVNGKFTVTCSNFFGRGKSTKRIVETFFDKDAGLNEINLKLSLHENESFITQIPQQDTKIITPYYIKLDASDLDDFHEYTWNYYVLTPDKKSGIHDKDYYGYDDVIFQGGSTPILWAMSDGYNLAPTLEPSKLYCFQFVKVFDNLLIGRIKYFVNMVKKS